MKKILLFLIIFLISFSSLAVSAAGPKISAPSGILIDGETGQILFEKEKTSFYYAADFVKIINGITALDKENLSDILTVSNWAVDTTGDTTGFKVKEKLTLEDALAAMLLEGTEDSARIIADNLSPSFSKYITNMNQKTIVLRATNFSVSTVAGTASDKQIASVNDVANALLYSLKNKDFYNIYTAGTYKMRGTEEHKKSRKFTCANELVGGKYAYNGALGGTKAHSTSTGYHLATYAKQDNRTLIAVVMGAKSREATYKDTTALFNYGFKKWQSTVISSAEISKALPETIADKKINFTGADKNGNYYILAPVNQDKSKANKTVLEDDFAFDTAINENGYLHGTVTVSLQDTAYKGYNLLTASFYESYVEKNTKKFLTKIGIAILIILILALLAYFAFKPHRMRTSKYSGIPSATSIKIKNFNKKLKKLIMPKKEWNEVGYNNDLNRREMDRYFQNANKPRSNPPVPNQYAKTNKTNNPPQPRKQQQTKSNREIYEENKRSKIATRRNNSNSNGRRK